MTTPYLVLSTCPNQASAEGIATALVESGLAACVNIVPGLTSIYRWQGNLEKGQEVLLLIKTPHARRDELQQRLVELHPYEVPEIIFLSVERGHQPYLDWVEQCTTSS